MANSRQVNLYNVNSYDGPCSGPQYGVSNAMQDIARRSADISTIFFSVFPVTLFSYIAKISQKYAQVDFVIKVDTVDRDGASAKLIFKECRRTNNGSKHRATKGSWNFTSGYITAWIGILIYHGSTGNTK